MSNHVCLWDTGIFVLSPTDTLISVTKIIIDSQKNVDDAIKLAKGGVYIQLPKFNSFLKNVYLLEG